MSYNTKSVKYMKDLGYITEITEHYSSFSKRKHDFGGYLDAISLNADAKEGQKVVGVQLTSKSNVSARWKKISSPEIKCTKTGEMIKNVIPDKARIWLKCGNSLWILGWENSKPKDFKGKIREVFLDKNDNFVFIDREVTDGKIKKIAA